MDYYQIWCNLIDSSQDVAFCENVSRYLGMLRELGRIEGFRITRRKLGFGPEALGEFKSLMTVVTRSVHKEPTAAAGILHRMAQEVPDSVVIAYIGRSNGAGPVLSAMSTTPVITVPASAKDFPEDVWSSLRAPSSVPVMTVLEPSNAVLATLQILSARSSRRTNATPPTPPSPRPVSSTGCSTAAGRHCTGS